ncbi:MAG: OadG family protein [Anaerolineae bacterium]|nr:OadG family protein [Anaerolineae bacterium]
MSEILRQGLTISLLGMSLTFLALGLLVLMMILLERFTRPKPQPSGPAEMEPAETVEPIDPQPGPADEAVVAAIAAALAHLRPAAEVYPANLGAALEAGPGGWWAVGRARLQSVTTSRTTGWRD